MAALDYMTSDYCPDEDGGGDYEEPDPLHYHRMIRFHAIVQRNRIFWVLDVEGHGVLYLPKKICRNMKKKKGTVWVHREIYQKILNRSQSAVDMLPDLEDE